MVWMYMMRHIGQYLTSHQQRGEEGGTSCTNATTLVRVTLHAHSVAMLVLLLLSTMTFHLEGEEADNHDVLLFQLRFAPFVPFLSPRSCSEAGGFQKMVTGDRSFFVSPTWTCQSVCCPSTKGTGIR